MATEEDVRTTPEDDVHAAYAAAPGGPPPPPVFGYAEGDPPPAMAERLGMEPVPTEGPSDEVEGELIDPDEAEALSAQAAGETKEDDQ